MAEHKSKILITLKLNGQNGGPYTSHFRIMNDEYLRNKYEFCSLSVPRARTLINPFGFFSFVRSIKNAKPDAVHIAGLQLDGFLVMAACKWARVKTILAIHGSSSEAMNFGSLRRFLSFFVEARTIKRADIVYGVSDYVSSWDICKYAKRYFGTIYNLTSFDSNYSDASTIREELKIKYNDIVVTSTGRITVEKGYDILKEVVLRCGDVPNIKFIIAGDGPYRNAMENAFLASSMRDKVFLLGYRSDISNILSGSDIFIICTKHETLCISLLEAGFFRLPLIATNVGGIPEIIDSDCGYLIENGNVDGFTSALRELVNDASKRVSFGEMARKKIDEKFSRASIIKKIDCLYEEVLKYHGKQKKK